MRERKDTFLYPSSDGQWSRQYSPQPAPIKTITKHNNPFSSRCRKKTGSISNPTKTAGTEFTECLKPKRAHVYPEDLL